MMSMLGKLKDVQAKLKQAKEDLVHIRVTAESGAGLVKATVNGLRQVISIEIDPDLLKPEDKETVQDLTAAAVNKALVELEEKIKEAMKKSTEGVLPNIPGLDLGNLF